jgi:hypothetical protein
VVGIARSAAELVPVPGMVGEIDRPRPLETTMTIEVPPIASIDHHALQLPISGSAGCPAGRESGRLHHRGPAQVLPAVEGKLTPAASRPETDLCFSSHSRAMIRIGTQRGAEAAMGMLRSGRESIGGLKCRKEAQ